MPALLIYILVNIGFTLIVTKSKIFKSIREYLIKKSPNFFGYWIKCPQCFGFFAGVVTSLIWFSPTFSVIPISIYIYPILDRFGGMVGCIVEDSRIDNCNQADGDGEKQDRAQ